MLMYFKIILYPAPPSEICWIYITVGRQYGWSLYNSRVCALRIYFFLYTKLRTVVFLKNTFVFIIKNTFFPGIFQHAFADRPLHGGVHRATVGLVQAVPFVLQEPKHCCRGKCAGVFFFQYSPRSLTPFRISVEIRWPQRVEINSNCVY